MSDPYHTLTGTPKSATCTAKRGVTALVILGLCAAVIVLAVRDLQHTDAGGSDTIILNPLVPLEVSTRITLLINQKKDPCDDFYEYACGNTASHFPVDSRYTMPQVESFQRIATKLTAEQLELLTFDFPVVGTYYQSCMDAAAVERSGSESLRAVFALIARVAEPGATPATFWEVLGALRRLGLASDVLFDNGVLPFDLAYRWVMIGTAPGSNMQNFVSTAMAVRMQQLFARDALPGTTANTTLQQAYAAKAKTVMTEMIALTRGKTTFPSKNMTTAGVADFQQYYGIDLVSFFKGLATDTMTGASVPLGLDRVLISFPDIFANMGAFVTKAYSDTPATATPELLRLMLQLHVVSSSFFNLPTAYVNAWVGRLVTSNDAAGAATVAQLRNAIAEPSLVQLAHASMSVSQSGFVDERVLEEARHRARAAALLQASVGDERADACTQRAQLYFRSLLTQQWIARSFPMDNKKVGQSLTDRIHEALGDRLRTVEWLDDATRARALEKWSLMAANVAYDPLTEFDKWEGVSMGNNLMSNYLAASAHTMWHESLRFIAQPTTTLANRYRFPNGVDLLVQNAYYYPSMNSINLLLGLMLEPLFAARYPDMLNLAAYGYVIGHEFTHGFDNNGRLYNGTGFAEDWWTPAATTAFTERAQCLIDQYNTFYPGQDGFHVNGKQTLGENIADLGGLGVAWAAYKKLNATEQLMPSTGLTNDQLFWVYAGQVWCGVGTASQYVAQILGDVHSPSPSRINGPMSNIKGFAESFHCSPTSAMGRSLTSKQCNIW